MMRLETYKAKISHSEKQKLTEDIKREVYSDLYRALSKGNVKDFKEYLQDELHQMELADFAIVHHVGDDEVRCHADKDVIQCKVKEDNTWKPINEEPVDELHLMQYVDRDKECYGFDCEKVFIPYPSKRRGAVQVPSYEAFMALSTRRRSVRWFKDQKVPRALVDKALAAAVQSPSACNRQPFSYRIFDDPDMVQEIAQIPFGTTGFSHNFPMIAVVVGDMSKFFAARDRHVIYIDSSLSIMAFLYALETLGLSSLTINCQDFSIIENRLKKSLGLKPYERPILMLAVGYAKDEGMIPFSCKKPLNRLRIYNTRGGPP